ncbi:MAG: hypothetical protein AAGU05_11315, partial [Anaerolineaceae bacterium]
AESPDHPHVHFHIIPRMADQPEDRRSTMIFGYLGVPEEQRVQQKVMDEIGLQVRQRLAKDFNEEMEATAQPEITD